MHKLENVCNPRLGISLPGISPTQTNMDMDVREKPMHTEGRSVDTSSSASWLCHLETLEPSESQFSHLQNGVTQSVVVKLG